MTDQIRAELLKIRSTRTRLGLVAGMVALIVLFALLAGLLTKAPHLVTPEDQRGLLNVGSTAGLFSALAGVMLITSEYRHGTIRPTFLFDPRRSHVIAAKAAAGFLAGIAFGLVGEALGLGIGSLALAARGIPFALSTGQAALMFGGGLAAVALWGVIGVAVGAIVRSQVGTIIGLLALGADRRQSPLCLRPLRRPLQPQPRRKRPRGPHRQTPPPGSRRRRRPRRLGRRAHDRRHPRDRPT